jgi:hypothetical protein
MGDEREAGRDVRREEDEALEEIRQLFARYRRIARHGVVAERTTASTARGERRIAPGLDGWPVSGPTPRR